MKAKILKSVRQFLLQVVCTTALLMALSIGLNGMYLLGIPKAEQVESATVTWLETGEVRQLTEQGDLETAVSLTGFLKYVPFSKADPAETPVCTLAYTLNTGETVTVSAAENTLWWHGRAHRLKHTGAFLKIAKGIYFLD